MQVVEINHVGLQAAQAVFAIAPQRLWPAVDHTANAIGELHARHATLARQRDALPVRLQHAAKQRLVLAKPIQGSRVEQRDARVQRGLQDALRLLRRDWLAVSMAQVHAAQANGADVKGTKLSVLHGRMICSG